MQDISEHRLEFFVRKTKEYISNLPFVSFNRELQSIEYEHFVERDLITFKIKNDRNSIFGSSIQGDTNKFTWLCYTSAEGYYFELRDAMIEAMNKATELTTQNKNTIEPDSLQSWLSQSRLGCCFAEFKSFVKIKSHIVENFFSIMDQRLATMLDIGEKKLAKGIHDKFKKELLDHAVFNGFRSNKSYLMPNTIRPLWEEFLEASNVGSCLNIQFASITENTNQKTDGFYLTYEEITNPQLFIELFDLNTNEFITFVAKKYDLMRKQRILGELDTAFMVFFLNDVSNFINVDIDGKNLIFPSFVFEGIDKKQIYEEILC